jgi:hypothetical protein
MKIAIITHVKIIHILCVVGKQVLVKLLHQIGHSGCTNGEENDAEREASEQRTKPRRGIFRMVD